VRLGACRAHREIATSIVIGVAINSSNARCSCRAFAAPRDPVSRAYDARKISQGKRHNQALIALARRRCDVLFAMLRDGTFYTPTAARNIIDNHIGAPPAPGAAHWPP
jgi:hypothetical protein